MKQWQKEIKQAQLDREKQVYKELEGTYRQALDDVNKKAKDLQDQISKLVADDPENESLLRSKVYQLKYQEQIKAQLDDAMNRLNDAGSITAYMEDMYKEGYASNIYALQKQGVPVIAPINHDKMLTALTYNTNNIPLSTRLYKNVEKTKKQVMSEITRGIASGMSNQDVARNIKNRMGVSYRKARQLAQNEGHRVNTQAVMDSMHDAKDRGADIVKQWDCTYDKKTRPVHRELDQKWAEVDEKFKYSGGEVFAPKEFGIPSQDINCRCALLSVPRWDVDSDTPQHYDNMAGEIIEAKNYDDWKSKYYDITENDAKPDNLASMDDLVDAIYNTSNEYLGIRWLAEDENYDVGDICRNSYDWDYDMDVSTYETDGRELDGTCAIKLRFDDYEPETIKEELERVLKNYSYWGKPVLIGGDRMTYGMDDDEIIIEMAEVIAKIRTDK